MKEWFIIDFDDKPLPYTITVQSYAWDGNYARFRLQA